MKQICKFNTQPATINSGGYKKGRWIVWLNLGVTELEPEEVQTEHFQCTTDRLVLDDFSVAAFLKVVDSQHIAMATKEEIGSILRFFNAIDDLESWKSILKVLIHGYDTSEYVNCFYLDGLALWLDKATRVGLVNSLSMEKSAGRTISTLWVNNKTIQLPIDLALGLLQALELYALDCYGVTASHLAFIDKAESIESLKDFDKGADYPETLRFKISE